MELGIAPVNESGDISYAYGNGTLAARSLVKRRAKEAQGFVTSHGNSPILYWMLGAIGQYRYVFYVINVKSKQGYYHPYTPSAKALRNKGYQSYYRKALDLDEAVDAPEHLTVEMLGTMADDVLAAPDIKERGYKKSIALAQAGKADVESGRFEYETYQFLLESYSAQKNPDKYLETLNEMIERFGSNEELEGYKRHVETVIEQRDRKAALEASKVVAKQAEVKPRVVGEVR